MLTTTPARHPARALKAGDICLLEACNSPQLLDERLLDLIGFALIAQLAHVDVNRRGRHAAMQALRISAELNIGPYLLARHASQALLEACAREVALL